MMKELLPIVSGDITLYVKPNYKETEFSLEGFTVKRDHANYYCLSLYGASYSCIPEERTPIEISEYLLSYYKDLADAQLQESLETQTVTCDLQQLENEEQYKDFWAEAICSAGKEIKNDIHGDVLLEKIRTGIVVFEIGSTYCRYDFIKNQHIGYFNSHDNEVDISPMQLFYGGVFLKHLALEQHRQGIAPPAYTELVKLGDFLRDKKSLKLVMKNGVVHEYKNNYGGDVTARDLLVSGFLENRTVFFLNDNYYMKPRFAKNLPLSELDYLQFGRNKHYIDAAALELPVRDKEIKNGDSKC